MSDFKYVKDFEFPSEQGFSGSAGRSNVKGYMRGGKVKATNNASGKASAARAKAKPSVGAKKGGYMRDGYKHIGGPRPEEEYPSEAKQTMPKGVKKRGGAVKKARGGTVGVTTERGPKSRKPKDTMTKAQRGGSVHDKLYSAGADMGYARGGQVKDTSGEFDMKSKPQPSMDSGTDPGKPHNQAEKEAGGRKRTLPKLKKGGKVAVARVRPSPDKTKGKGRSKRGMPKNVKAKGGLAKYAEGGRASPSDIPGTGGARRAAEAIRDRELRVRKTVDEALRGQSQTQKPRPVAQTKDRPPKPKGKPPGKIYREEDNGTPTFTDVPKTGKPYKRSMRGGRVGKRVAAR